MIIIALDFSRKIKINDNIQIATDIDFLLPFSSCINNFKIETKLILKPIETRRIEI